MSLHRLLLQRQLDVVASLEAAPRYIRRTCCCRRCSRSGLPNPKSTSCTLKAWGASHGDAVGLGPGIAAVEELGLGAALYSSSLHRHGGCVMFVDGLMQQACRQLRISSSNGPKLGRV